MRNTMTSFLWLGTLLAGALAAPGCGEMPAGEGGDIDTVESAFSEPACTTATADRTYNGGADPAFVSPATYSNPRCGKSEVVDIWTYSATYAGPPAGGGFSDGHTIVHSSSALPATQTACESLWLGALLYRRQNGAWVQQKLGQSFGSWTRQPISGRFGCTGPAVTFHTTNDASKGFTADLVVGNSYRIAGTARTADSSSAPTRSLTIASAPPTVLR